MSFRFLRVERPQVEAFRFEGGGLRCIGSRIKVAG